MPTTAIAEVCAWLQKRHPELRYVAEGRSLTVSAPTPNGFDVTLIENDGVYIVAYDGWHEHFESQEEALRCFGSAFSDDFRLRVTLRGDYPYKWTLEHKKDGAWTEWSTTGLFLFPFWRRRRVQYRQNHLNRGESP